MKTRLTLFTFLFLGNVFCQIPLNENIRFSISTLLEKFNGIYMDRRRQIVIDDTVQYDHQQIVDIVSLLKDDNYDFSATIILYAIRHLEATSIYGLTMGDVEVSSGKIVCSKVSVNIWRQASRKKEIEY